MKRDTLFWVIAMVLTFGLTACAGSNIPDARPTTGRNPQVAEVPDPDETVRGEDDPPVVTLELGSSLRDKRLSEGEDLPGNIIIPTTNLNAVPVTAALQAVLAGTDVSLSWDAGTFSEKLVTVMNLSGPLPRVVDKICSAAKVFCSYRHGSLELSEKETFIVALPPIANKNSVSSTSISSSSSSSSSTSVSAAAASTGNSMVEALNQLMNGGKAQVDDQGGNIIYTTDVDGQNKVRRYLEELRNGRPLIVLQLYVWEVTLNKENAAGVNWDQIKLGNFGPAFAKLTSLASASNLTSVTSSGSVSLGAITTGRLNSNILARFLSTQGRLQTISSPQVTFISGSGATLKIGGTQRYISQVGQLVTSNNTSGTNNNTTSGVGSNTVNTDKIDTGLTVDVNGSYENGVVLANLDLSLTNLVSLNPTASGGGTINLPQTTDEKMSTVIRVRPGDNLVMAGLVTSADTNSRQGLPLPGDARLPLYGDDILQNRELVIIVKPSVVLFSDAAAREEKAKREATKGLPDAVMIDKDGAKTIAIPKTVARPSLPPQAAEVQPELMVKEPNPAPLGNIPISAGTDNALVDKRLMQRGFSHAFDELLDSAPAPSTISAGGNEAQP